MRLQQAEKLFGRHFELPPITFDLTGRAAGMYVRQRTQRRIRFNPYIFAKYFQDSLDTTVPHEVSHYISDLLYGLRNIRPHGTEWRQIMHAFGVAAEPTCHYDLEGIPLRRYRHYSYRCGCRLHALTSRRHNKICRGETRYFCRSCGGALCLSEQPSLLAD
jgi:SprT protein